MRMMFLHAGIAQSHINTTPTHTPCRYIFAHHGKRFFRCMANIYGWQRAKQIRKAESYNVGKPPSKRRRVPHWKAIEPDSSETSDTVATSSGADDKCPFYERSLKITPHAVVHFADQVIMGGTHSFHNTAAAESLHPRCIAQAALRARTYHDVNSSARQMLEYLVDKDQMQKIIELTNQSATSSAYYYVILVCHDVVVSC